MIIEILISSHKVAIPQTGHYCNTHSRGPSDAQRLSVSVEMPHDQKEQENGCIEIHWSKWWTLGDCSADMEGFGTGVSLRVCWRVPEAVWI